MPLRSIPPYTMTARRGQRHGDLAIRRIGNRPAHPQAHLGPTTRTRGDDVLIPPRTSVLPVHETLDTDDAYVVRIAFPTGLLRTNLHWQLKGDVLEVEYLGRDAAYYHNFLVPNGPPPKLQVGQDVFEAQFLKSPQTRSRKR